MIKKKPHKLGTYITIHPLYYYVCTLYSKSSNSLLSHWEHRELYAT